MAGDEGAAFMKSKEGCVRLLVIFLLLTAFVLIAVSGFAGVITWVFVAYIISWVISLQTYFFIAIRVASHMQCGVSFDDVDIVLSVFSFFNCLLASFVLAIYARATTLWIVAVIIGFIVALLYSIELCLLREKPPLNLQYLISKNGIVKASILVFGCGAFVLLHASGYRCQNISTGCDVARIWVFVTFIYCWAISTILLFLRLLNVAQRFSYFELFDLLWSLFSFFNYLVASIVLVNFLFCTSFGDFECGTRLAAVIFGFYVALLYLIDTILLKKKFGRVLDQNVFEPKPNKNGTREQTISETKPRRKSVAINV